MAAHWEDEYYRIDEDSFNNEKYIVLLGYFYDVGEPGYNENGNEDENYTSRDVSYVIEFPLQEFIDRFVNGNEDLVDSDEYLHRKEYIEDVTPEYAVNVMNESTAKPLSMRTLTINTPCGYYVDEWE